MQSSRDGLDRLLAADSVVAMTRRRGGDGPAHTPSIFERLLTRRDASTLATTLRALGDPERLRILTAVAAAGGLNVSEMMRFVSIAQPTVSHHLKVLHDAGFVERAKHGTWVVYTVVPERLAALGAAFELPPRPKAVAKPHAGGRAGRRSAASP
jgi:ArsR family transcriptional regulator